MLKPRRLASRVRVIHTLGPQGTNCEAAAKYWFENHRIRGDVVLHSTLEEAADCLEGSEDSALLGCIVYPELHTLVFSNLKRFSLVDLFILPTHNMVLASRTDGMPNVVSSHPAPQKLIPEGAIVRLVTSTGKGGYRDGPLPVEYRFGGSGLHHVDAA